MVESIGEFEHSADVQERCYYGSARAQLLLADGEPDEAQEVAESVFAERDVLGIGADVIKEAFALAVQAALELDRLDKADELLAIVEQLPTGVRPQFLSAHESRFRAHLAARRGDRDETERLFKGGAGLFQELAVPFHLAVTQLEYGEWLAAEDRAEADPLFMQARETFERLDAKPWLERIAGGRSGTQPRSLPQMG
jgi:hypothetical protein